MSSENKRKRQGVLIFFTAHGASLNVEECLDKPAPRSISLCLQLVKFVGRQQLQLPDNSTLEYAQWSMYITESESTEIVTDPNEQDALGTLRYSDNPDNPESCFISAALKPGNFAALLDAIQAGRFPFWLSVEVRGMEYAGAGVVWDVKANPEVFVLKLSFRVRLTALDISALSNCEPFDEADSLPASSADIRALQKFLGEKIDLLKFSVWSALILAVFALLAGLS